MPGAVVRTFIDPSGSARAQAGGGPRCDGLEIDLLEFEGTPETTAGGLRTIAGQGVELIVSPGFLQADAVQAVSAEFADTFFVLIDEVVEGPNVRSVLFEEHEGSFLVGYYLGDLELQMVDTTIGFTSPETLYLGLTSVLKRVDVAAYDAIQNVVAGIFEPDTMVLGLAEEGVGFALDEYNEARLPDGLLAELAMIGDMIVSGQLVVEPYADRGSSVRPPVVVRTLDPGGGRLVSIGLHDVRRARRRAPGVDLLR